MGGGCKVVTSVDERVVQLVFDNEKFDPAVEKTIETLDNLKENLNLEKASKEFNKIEQAANNLNMDGLANNVDKISDRFTTLGIVGVTALQNITTATMNTVANAFRTLTTPLIEGGKRRALNLEQAQFQIEGLGYAWKEVKKDVDYAVDGTAYGLDVAAKAAGQLLASNVQIGDSMKTALRGISGVASMTGREYEDISRIFTTVAGNGRLMGDQLNQLSSSGINAAATLGKHLNKTEAQIREMVSKGKIDFATFAEAMDSAFGEHATAANETFEGSLSNMNAALSRIGADFFTPYFENMIKVNNALRYVFKSIQDGIQPLVTAASSGMKIISDYIIQLLPKTKEEYLAFSELLSGPLSKISEILTSLGSSLWNVFKALMNVVGPVVQAFAEAFGGTLLDVILRVVKAIEQFTNDLIMNDVMTENLKKTFQGLFTILASVLDVISQVVVAVGGVFLKVLTTTFGIFADILLKITGFLGEGVTKVKEFVDGLLQLESVQEIIRLLSSAFQTLKRAIGIVVNFVHELLNVLLDSAFDGINWIFSRLAKAVLYAAEALSKLILKFVDWLRYVKSLPEVQAFLEKIRNTLRYMRDNFGELASAIKDNLYRTFGQLGESIDSVLKRVKEFLTQFGELPSLQDAASQAQNVLIDAFKNGSNVFEAFGNVLMSIMGGLKDLGGSVVLGVADKISKLSDGVSNLTSTFEKVEDVEQSALSINNSLSSVSDSSESFIDKIKGMLSGFINWLGEKFSKITFGDVIQGFMTVGSISMIVTMIKTFKSIESSASSVNKVIDSLAGTFKSISGFIDTASGYLKDRLKVAKLDAFSNIIKSIVALAAALAILAMMDQGKLIVASVVLGALTVGMVALFSFITKTMDAMKNPKSILSAISLMITISGSLITLAIALKILSSISLERVGGALIAMGTMMGELAAVLIIITKYSKKMKSSLLALLTISNSLISIAMAMKILGSMDSSSLSKATEVVITLLAVMTAVMLLVSSVKLKSCWMILEISGFLMSAVTSLKILSGIDSEKLIVSLMVLRVLFMEMSLMLVVAELAGTRAVKAGKSLMGISASLAIIAVAMKMLGNLSKKEIENSISAISQLTILFGMLLAVSNLAGKRSSKAGRPLIEMSIALIAVSGAMMMLSTIDPNSLGRVTNSISSIIGMFTIFTLLASATEYSKKASKAIKYLTIAIVSIGGIMAILSLADPRNLMAATASLESLMICFAIISNMSKYSESGYKSLKELGIMLLVVESLSLIIRGLASLPVENVVASAASLSAMIVSLSIAISLISRIGLLGPKLISSAAIAGVAMDAILLVVGGFIGVVGLISMNVPNFQKALDHGIPVMQAIGTAIGSLIGGLVGGFVGGASNGISIFSENMKNLIDPMVELVNVAKNMDESARKGVESMIAMILSFATADFLDAISFWSDTGSSMNSLKKNLPEFAKAMKDFSEEFKDVDTGKLAEASEAAKFLAEMASALPRENGLVNGLLGNPGDMKKFGENLTSFGTALKNYANEVDGLKSDAINNSIEPARSLIEIGNLIPESGGLIQEISGEKNMDLFGENLAAFGKSLVSYADEVDGLKTSAINDSIEPIRSLIQLNSELDNLGGAIGWFVGDHDFDLFGQRLASFGSSLKNYSDAITENGGINFEKIEEATKVIAPLVEISNALPEIVTSSGVQTNHRQSLQQFGNTLAGFGTALSNYNDEVKDTQFNTSAIHDSASAALALAEVANALPTIKEYVGMFGDSTTVSQETLSNFGSNIAGLGDAVAKYNESVSGESFDVAKIEASASAVNAVANLLDSMPITTITQWGSMTSSTTLSEFGSQLWYFGLMLKLYSSAVSTGIDVAAIENSVEAAKSIVDISRLISEIDNGTTNLSDFSSSITSFGAALSTYSGYVSNENFDLNSIKGSIEAIEGLINLTNTLSSGDTSGVSVISESGEAIKTFGTNYLDFYNSVTQVDTSVVDSILTQFTSMLISLTSQLELLESLSVALKNYGTSVIESLTSMFNGAINEAKSIATEFLNTFMETISSANAQMSLTAQSLINSFKDALRTASFSLIEAGTESVNNLSTGVETGKESFISSCKTLVENGVKTIEAYTTNYKSVGVKLIESLISGFESKKSSFLLSFKSLIQSAYSGVDLSPFYTIGQNIALGLANGVASKRDAVIGKAREIANSAALIMARTLDEHSPSKVTERIGEYATLGLANGIENFAGKVEASSKYVAMAAVDETSKILSIIGDTIDNELEFNPVITPVLDASQLNSSINSYGLNFNPMFGSNANNLASAFNRMDANAISAMNNQNGINLMVNELSDKVDDLKDSIYSLANSFGDQETALYIDGKKIASTIAKPMNQILGARVRREGF